MKRTPPQIRESAVGIPPLSQTLQQKNLEAHGPGSSTAQTSAAQNIQTPPNNDLPRNSPPSIPPDSDLEYVGQGGPSVDKLRVTQRNKRRNYYGKNTKKKGKSPAIEAQDVASHAVHTNTDLLCILKEIQEEMVKQKNENAEMKQEIRQLKSENSRLQYQQCSKVKSNLCPKIKADSTAPECLEKKSLISEEYACGSEDNDPEMNINNRYQYQKRRQHSRSPSFGRYDKIEVPKGLRILLDDGKSPTYDAWEHLMRANLRTYRHTFRDKISIIDHIFAQTTGIAMNHLTQRMKYDHPQAFTHEDQMFEWLHGFFKDPNERETARIEYNRCRMSTNETFNQFYSRFSALASKARIEQSDQLRDMFRKFHPDLHQQAINFMATDPDYQIALKRFHFLDNELRINRENRSRRKLLSAAIPLSASAPSGQKNSPLTKREYSMPPNFQTTHTVTDNRSAQPNDIPVRKCYNCHKRGHISKECPDTPNPQTRTSEIRQIEKMAAGENDDENFPEDFNEQEIYEESENEKP